MKKLAMTFLALALIGLAQAQEKKGRVLYELIREVEGSAVVEGQVVKLPIKIQPVTMEVLFGNDQSIIRHLGQSEGANQANIPVSDRVIFTNLKNRAYVRNLSADKEYLICDTVSKLNWTLTGETKTILGYNCQKATASRIRQKPEVNSGDSTNEELTDVIVVWFAPSIPVAAGPDLQGQLPGLILELDINNGNEAYKALELSAKVKLSDIKEPVIGTRVTEKAYIRILSEWLTQMYGGGEATIQMSN